MKRLLVVAVLVIACSGAPKIEPEPEPAEPAFELGCDLKAGMEPDVVERKCGVPYSKMYAPEYDDAVIWRYCGKKSDGSYEACHQTYGVIFYGGTVLRWGRVYEVVQ